MKKQQQIIKRVYKYLTDSIIGLWIIKNINSWILFANFYSDFKRFLNCLSVSNKISTKTNLIALITTIYSKNFKDVLITDKS
ncbi:hypothetical protein ACP6PL_19525 [Dapis sp. BLCC M126]|uniref:hypothetical protein n=1 Tax=Dapis sp. BLCC M126 TaxID=3400189 RepID=UPI003CE69413